MSAPLLIPLPGNEAMAEAIARHEGGEVHRPEIRSFPDGETYLRLDMDLHGRAVAIVCTLDHPDAKILPLLFAAGTVHELGAASVGLIAPYLAYMRQDRRFHPGEAITARQFAALLSPHFDWLVTVDPHLHRIRSLSGVYDLANRTVHASRLIAEWIAREVPRPMLIGPDSESVQWVAGAARIADAPVVTLAKTRLGDSAVGVQPVDLSPWHDRTPVLVDDIISTGQTMIETLHLLKAEGMAPAVCIGIHGLFAGRAYDALRAAGAARIVTTNTIAHPSNAIDMSGTLAAAMREILP